MVIESPFTAIEMTGAISASSAASSALSFSSFRITNAHSQTSWPVWLTSSRRVQNSISRETLNGTRVSFFVGFAGTSWRVALAMICKNRAPLWGRI